MRSFALAIGGNGVAADAIRRQTIGATDKTKVGISEPLAACGQDAGVKLKYLNDIA
jgi:hypothetical protein